MTTPFHIHPIPIGETVTAIDDPACSDQIGIKYDGQQVLVLDSYFSPVEDSTAPLGYRYLHIYEVRAQDGMVLHCQRHELLRRDDWRVYAPPVGWVARA